MATTLFIGPALRMLALTFGCEGASMNRGNPRGSTSHRQYATRTLLADVAASAPGLASLTVYGGTLASLFTPIGDMRALNILDLTDMRLPFGVELLRRLAGLKMLEKLSLRNTFDARDAAPCPGFKALWKLAIRGGATTVPALLACMPDLDLLHLCLDDMSSREMDAIQDIADVLSSGPGVDIIDLGLSVFTNEPEVAIQSVSTIIEPFFALKRIRQICFNSVQHIVTRDEDLLKIGAAWPELECLLLGCFDYDNEPIDPLTIDSVVELAYTCPRLQGVHLHPWDTVPVLLPEAVNPSPTGNNDNIILDVRIPDEKIRDVEQVADVLCKTFGKLRFVEPDREQYGKWGAVVDEMARW